MRIVIHRSQEGVAETWNERRQLLQESSRPRDIHRQRGQAVHPAPQELDWLQFHPSNDSPTLLELLDLDEARVDTLGHWSEGGDIDSGSRD